MRPSTLERVAGAVALSAMLATPFVPVASRGRVALTWTTVLAGATRTWSIERRCRGAATATATASGAVAATLAAEVVGTTSGRLFGRYGYTDRLRPLVGGVPLLVPLAWYTVLVPARTVAHRALGTRSTPLTRVGVGAAAMTAWDLFLDPQMTAQGFWRWPDGGRYRGIPLRNFAGWFLVAAGVSAALEVTCAPSDDDAHVATYGALGVLETVAFSTFWRDPMIALMGGVGMLPVAAGAAVRRTVR